MRGFLVLLLVVAVQCRLAPFYRVEPNIPGQFIVVVEDHVDVNRFAANMESGLVLKVLKGILNAVVLNIDESRIPSILSLPEVKYVEQNGLATVQRDATDFWGLDRIDQHDLHLDGKFSINGNGTGANVYVIDTGIRYTHTEFGGRAKEFFDFQEGGNGNDCHGHGTHCAGTVGGVTAGVATGATILSVRVMDCGGRGSYSDIIAGLDAVVNDGRDNKVASMSIGGGKSEALNSAVAGAHASGVAVVVAAGNSNLDACLFSQSSATAAITVGATTSADWRATYSNFGTCVDIFAPGTNVKSADYKSNTGYTTISGTSMACPHVAGVAAVHKAKGITNENVANILVSQSTKGAITNPKGDNHLLYIK